MIPTTSRMAADPLRRRPRCRCPAGGSSPPTRPSPSPAASSCSNFDLSRGMDFGYISLFNIYIYMIIHIYIYICILYVNDCICIMRFYRIWSWVNYSGRNDCFFFEGWWLNISRRNMTKPQMASKDLGACSALFDPCAASCQCHVITRWTFAAFPSTTILRF